jgi:hypothetical protein
MMVTGTYFLYFCRSFKLVKFLNFHEIFQVWSFSGFNAASYLTSCHSRLNGETFVQMHIYCFTITFNMDHSVHSFYLRELQYMYAKMNRFIIKTKSNFKVKNMTNVVQQLTQPRARTFWVPEPEAVYA